MEMADRTRLGPAHTQKMRATVLKGLERGRNNCITACPSSFCSRFLRTCQLALG